MSRHVRLPRVTATVSRTEGVDGRRVRLQQQAAEAVFHRETRPQVLFLLSGENTDFLIVSSLSRCLTVFFFWVGFFLVCVRFHGNTWKVLSFTVKPRSIFGRAVMQFVLIWFNLLPQTKKILLELKIQRFKPDALATSKVTLSCEYVSGISPRLDDEAPSDRLWHH